MSALHLAFVIDPIDDLKVYKDTTVTMMAAAAARGHRLSYAQQGWLGLEGGRVLGRFVDIELTGVPLDGRSGPWYREVGSAVRPLSAFDAILMRKDPPFDMEYVYSTYLLERGAQQGARVFNDPRAVRDHNEKFSITEFNDLTAETIVSRDPARIRLFVADQGEAVLKLLDGMGGTSIFRVRSDDPNLSVILETMNQFGSRTVMAQRYLPEIREGDKRVLLIGGEVVPFSLARIPQAGESRGNLAAGGTGRAQPLTEDDRRIAQRLAPILLDRGLFLVGLDVIGSSLTEINVTSPTCFREIADQTGFDVAGLFIDRLVARLGR
jgi:glutathione synthase